MNRRIARMGMWFLLSLAVAMTMAQAGQRDASDDPADMQPLLTLRNQGKEPSTGRLMVILDGPATDDRLAKLRDYGTVHGVIQRYNVVAMTPSGPNGRRAIERLWFVRSVENDQPRSLTDAGTWDRDIINVVDVEETGVIGDPDARQVAQTGAGVHVAVIDSGLVDNWRDFLIESRVRPDLARAFMGGGAVGENFVPADEFHISNPTDLWEHDTSSHGTSVASHIIGFKRGALVADGVAPGAKIIPLKVFPNGEAFTWSSRIIAAVAYVADLKERGIIGPTVINLSLGGSVPTFSERAALNDAIERGVIVVAAAGNEGEAGMSWPGAYPEIISAGAIGWTRQFLPGSAGAINRAFWWTQDVPEGGEASQSYVADFSSRAIPALGTLFGVEPQQLDVLAPGVWTVAPGGHNGTSAFFFWAGTSFASPLTAGVAALILEKNPVLAQAQVEAVLRTTAQPLAANDTRPNVLEINGVFFNAAWDTDCGGLSCDPVGAGLLNVKGALAAVKAPKKSFTSTGSSRTSD